MNIKAKEKKKRKSVRQKEKKDGVKGREVGRGASFTLLLT